MKKRRGRRGFWWWSWLLVLATIGGSVGGFLNGKKEWEAAPKEYLSTATLSVHVRNPFVPLKSKTQVSTSKVADENEIRVMREVKSVGALEAISSELELGETWGMNAVDVVTKLRTALELDLDKERDELRVNVILNDPQLASDVANAIAKAIPQQIKNVDERNKETSMKQLELEVEPFVDDERDARTILKKQLQAKKYLVEPEPGVDLGSLLLDPAISQAKVAWDGSLEILESSRDGQAEYRNYWARSVKPSFVTTKAIAPPSFVGPRLEPFQKRWSVYGLTGGMLLGLLLMVIFWKLFP